MNIAEARDHQGERVRYSRPGQPDEYGTITGFSTGHLVFVRYDGDQFSKATDPADLELVTDLSTGYTRLAYVADDIALAFYPDGSVGLRHRCTRPRDGQTLIVAPRLRLGDGHTLDEATLTVTPSCGCHDCGLHGWVRDGGWVPA